MAQTIVNQSSRGLGERVRQQFDAPDFDARGLRLTYGNHAGQVIMGVLTIPEEHRIDPISRQLVAVALFERRGDHGSRHLAVARYLSKPDGEPLAGSLQRNYRLGGAIANLESDDWVVNPGAYPNLGPWQNSTQPELAADLRNLASPSARNPQTDELAHAYLLQAMRKNPDFAWGEPLFSLYAQLLIAATPPL